ncbi:MAG: aminotransferase class IV, partial [Bacteroidota bacterium]
MYYNENTVLFLDGKFVKAVDAKLDLFSQTLHYGYGAFEGIRSYQTINGVKIFKPHEHFARLKRSCELIGIPMDYSVEELTQLSYQVLEKNNLSNAYLRPACILQSKHVVGWPERSFRDGRRLGLGKILQQDISSHLCFYFPATQSKIIKS